MDSQHDTNLWGNLHFWSLIGGIVVFALSITVAGRPLQTPSETAGRNDTEARATRGLGSAFSYAMASAAALEDLVPGPPLWATTHADRRTGQD